MTRIVSGLVERDWIKRIADTDDARAWQLAISSKGVVALSEWRSRLATALLPIFSDLDENETRTIRNAIELVRPRVTQRPADLSAQAEKESK
jgi:DNA-binding MarR family transcriptional regulator